MLMITDPLASPFAVRDQGSGASAMWLPIERSLMPQRIFPIRLAKVLIGRGGFSSVRINPVPNCVRGVGLDREKHLSNAEIAWFVVGYDPKPGGWALVPREVVFTKLDASVKSLTGGEPLSRERFEERLREKLARTVTGQPPANSK